MVDNRSAGFFGVGGAFNFKSGDISGTAAKTQDDKMGQGTEYGVLENYEEEQQQNNAPYVDRSAQLRATLNSMAMMNVAGILKTKKRADILDEKDDNPKDSLPKEDSDEEFVDDFSDTEEEDNEYY